MNSKTKEDAMLSRINRATAISFTAVVLTVLVMGCSTDNNVQPTAPIDNADPQTAGRTSVNFGDVPEPNSGAPAQGIVIEGVSVPGIALGYTRAQVEAAYGDPNWCQNVNGYDQGSCQFPVEGGGQVDVLYRGANGGPANNSPDDVVFHIRWYESVPGWITTAGITTTLAAENPDAVIAAYPDAEINYSGFGGLYSVIDYQQGIQVLWVPDFYRGTTHVYMSIRYPSDPPPPPQEHFSRVTDIDLTARKIKGKRQINAAVRVQDELNRAVPAAAVSVVWLYPDGITQTEATATTNSSGLAHFGIADIPRGEYTLTVENVVREYFTFDSANSILNASVNVK
jgi:hypothetical protein